MSTRWQRRQKNVADNHREALARWYGKARAKSIQYAEVFEICEYGRRPTERDLRELFPFLGQARILRQWAGVTDMTPDYSPVMGLSPVENYYLDAGWGTWGFKATPICGKTMAELVATSRVPELIEPFTLERFYRFEQVNEAGATAASH